MQHSKEISNVSATTAIELKAELAQHIDQFEKTRSSSGKQVTAKRPDKKPTVWSRQNQGVHERNQRDKSQQLSQVETDVLKRSREQLEKKARFYEAMRSGKYKVEMGDNEDDAPLVDFDRKYFQEKELEEEMNEKRKKRKTRDDSDDDDDPWVEYEDEFGRTRIVRQSEARKLQREDEDDEDDYFDENKDYIDYRPSEESIMAADRSDMAHYEADREIRTKGVGFYRFSKDEEERQAQMDKLNKIRQDTENARKSAISSASKRKQMLAQNAEKIRARKAALQAKKNHQLKPEQVPKDVNIPSVVTEESVTDFLKSVRKQLE